MNAPGKSHRRGLTLMPVTDMFRDERSSMEWIASKRWANGPACPKCSTDNVQSNIKHKTMTHRCRECEGKPMFTVKKGTIMEGSKLPYRTWAIGIYLFSANINGVSSMRLHRELGITQKSAWFMLQRLRKAYELEVSLFAGSVEVDEIYMGGKRRNMPLSKRKTMTGRGGVGKTAVLGAKDSDTNQINAKVAASTNTETLQGLVADNAALDAKVYTDEASAYAGMPFDHETVNHSAGQYVHGKAHTNGIESFWSMLKRGHKGIYHKMSPKHLHRYVSEFAGRHNVRECSTITQMACLVQGMYHELIEDSRLESSAR